MPRSAARAALWRCARRAPPAAGKCRPAAAHPAEPQAEEGAGASSSRYRGACRGSLALHALLLLRLGRGCTVVPAGDPRLSTRIAVEGDPTVRERAGTRHAFHRGTRVPGGSVDGSGPAAARQGRIGTSESLTSALAASGAVRIAARAGRGGATARG